MPRLTQYVLPAAPLVSVITIALICSSIIGQSSKAIIQSGPRLAAAVFLLHAGGFFFGYLFSKICGYNQTTSRTISIEVGMQNSGLGAVLARQHFSIEAAAPCAISSVFHSLIGSLLAAVWRLKPAKDKINFPAWPPK